MNYLLTTLTTLVLCSISYARAQDTINLYHGNSDLYNTLSDSLFYALENREYNKAYSFVLELNQRDSLSRITLSNCADCYIYLDRYDECLEFCDKWQSRYPDEAYNIIFSPIRGECHYYKKEYEQALTYFEEYRNLLNEDGQNMSPYYISLYANMYHAMYKYEDAENYYNAFLNEILDREGIELENAYLSTQNEWLGIKLYDYAYNSFFMGNEAKGMYLLSLSAKCGNEYAEQDYGILSNCETIMMDLELPNKIENQYKRVLENHDFKYFSSNDDILNIPEDFWNEFALSNLSVQELQAALLKKKKPKMLQKAVNEIYSEREKMIFQLENKCRPFEVGGMETGIVKKLVGNNNYYLNDFRVYPADDINAFATPYNQIYLTSGLVLQYHFKEHLLMGVCAHEMTHIRGLHSLIGLWKQYEKERRTEIAAGIAAGLYAATMAATSIYSASNGVSYDQSYYDNIAETTTDLYRAIDGSSFYFQFKYSREQELEADLIAYRFCEAIGLGGYAYIMSLQLLEENDLYMKHDKTDDHPTLAYRIAFLKWLYTMEN